MAANTGFVGLFNAVNQIIEVQTLLTFILVFTLVFAVFQKTKIIGDGKKNFNVMVALILAIMTVLPHMLGTVPASQDPVLIITSALPNVSVVVVAILGVLLLLGVFGNRLEIAGTSLGSLVAIAAFGTIVYIFGAAAGWFADFPPWLNFLNDSDTRAVLITVLVFAVVIWFISSDDETKVGGFMGDFLKGIRDSVK